MGRVGVHLPGRPLACPPSPEARTSQEARRRHHCNRRVGHAPTARRRDMERGRAEDRRRQHRSPTAAGAHRRAVPAGDPAPTGAVRAGPPIQLRGPRTAPAHAVRHDHVRVGVALVKRRSQAAPGHRIGPRRRMCWAARQGRRAVAGPEPRRARQRLAGRRSRGCRRRRVMARQSGRSRRPRRTSDVAGCARRQRRNDR